MGELVDSSSMKRYSLSQVRSPVKIRDDAWRRHRPLGDRQRGQRRMAQPREVPNAARVCGSGSRRYGEGRGDVRRRHRQRLPDRAHALLPGSQDGDAGSKCCPGSKPTYPAACTRVCGTSWFRITRMAITASVHRTQSWIAVSHVGARFSERVGQARRNRHGSSDCAVQPFEGGRRLLVLPDAQFRKRPVVHACGLLVSRRRISFRRRNQPRSSQRYKPSYNRAACTLRMLPTHSDRATCVTLRAACEAREVKPMRGSAPRHDAAITPTKMRGRVRKPLCRTRTDLPHNVPR